MPALLRPPKPPGEPELPRLVDIRDERHRVHRSCLTPDGRRRVVTPDELLRTADLARYTAAFHNGPDAVAPTVEAGPTHGPGARIDVVHAEKPLLPPVVEVEVVNLTGLADHHTVFARFDLDNPVGALSQLDLAV